MYGFLPGRVVVWVDTAVLCLTAVRIWRLFSNKKAKAGVDALVLFGNSFGLLLVFLFRMFRFSFLGDTAFPFWPIALVCGVGASVFVCAKWIWADKRFWKNVGNFILFVVVAATLVWGVLIHMNYALDFSSPEQCESVIMDKEIHRSVKGPTEYEFKLVVDGDKVTLSVPRTEYYNYGVGDTYSFKLYNGAFGVQFYICGK